MVLLFENGFSGWGQFLQSFCRSTREYVISLVASPLVIWQIHLCSCKSFAKIVPIQKNYIVPYTEPRICDNLCVKDYMYFVQKKWREMCKTADSVLLVKKKRRLETKRCDAINFNPSRVMQNEWSVECRCKFANLALYNSSRLFYCAESNCWIKENEL